MTTTDAEEYVAVQAGIDDVKGNDVFVIATVNDMRKLPESLTRAGRFDKNIKFYNPTFSDNVRIIKHYLKDKNVVKNIDIDDIAKMICFGSCAELESILNEAAIIAGYKSKSQIEMEDIVESVLKAEYDSLQDYAEIPPDELKKVAYHEAGHLIMSEMLCPESIGLASIRRTQVGKSDGFVRRCKELQSPRHQALICLSGKAAVELVYGSCADGTETDIRKACECIREITGERGYFGFSAVDVSPLYNSPYEMLGSKIETVISIELERCLFEAKEIIAKNRNTLDKIASALLKKETLLASDIKKLLKSA